VQSVVAFPSAKPTFTRRRFIEGGLARRSFWRTCPELVEEFSACPPSVWQVHPV